jgi:acetate kinase
VTDIIAVFNAGSSTLKFSVFRHDDFSLIHNGTLEVPDSQDGHKKALQQALGWISAHKDGLKLHVAGHRVVHGKDRAKPEKITAKILTELKTLIPLAPLHQPHNLRVIEELAALHPELPQVACFDTAFHRTQPKLASMFALPRRFYDDGVKRYGFHGISYEYIASVLPKYAGDKAKSRVIVAHLGNGASLCAMKNLQSQATSMGFSTLDGLMMGTRCGTLDVGVPLYMQQHLNMTTDQVTDTLYHKSGLLGVSGISNDMRTLEQSDAPEAGEAIALFCHMAAQHCGSLMSILGGLDALVFTAGIGEHSARVRREICHYLTWAGLSFDETLNQKNATQIHAKGSKIAAYVIPTDEEIVIARACRMIS